VYYFGYIDPGTGSLFLQAVIGAVLGGVFFFRRVIGKVIMKTKKMLRRNGKQQRQSDPQPDEE
jgi:hypothetical protein